MKMYQPTQEDELVINFVKNKLLPIANSITNFYSHWIYSDEEDHLQKAFLYECKQQNIKLTREINITQYYKDLAFTEKKCDFLIYPNQIETDLPTGILIETKHNHKKDDGTSNLDGRYQLFRYIYSSSHNPDEYLKNVNYGIFLEWGQNYDDKQFRNLETFSIVENKVGSYLELWKAVDPEKTKLAKIFQTDVEKPMKNLNNLKKEELQKICEEMSIEYNTNDTNPKLIEKINEAGKE